MILVFNACAQNLGKSVSVFGVEIVGQESVSEDGQSGDGQGQSEVGLQNCCGCAAEERCFVCNLELWHRS